MREISAADFESGNWAGDLRALLQMPAPSQRLATDGDRVCAAILARWP
jgi:hypothetical protein